MRFSIWMQTTGACDNRTTSAASKRCLRSRMPAVVRPCCCTPHCTKLTLQLCVRARSVAGIVERVAAPEEMSSTRWTHTRQEKTEMAALRGFGGVLQAVTGLRELPGRVGQCRAPGCLTARARWQPWRGLPASALVKPFVQQHKPAAAQCACGRSSRMAAASMGCCTSLLYGMAAAN
jgi:hypothetical protein